MEPEREDRDLTDEEIDRRLAELPRRPGGEIVVTPENEALIRQAFRLGEPLVDEERFLARVNRPREKKYPPEEWIPEIPLDLGRID